MLNLMKGKELEMSLKKSCHKDENQEHTQHTSEASVTMEKRLLISLLHRSYSLILSQYLSQCQKKITTKFKFTLSLRPESNKSLSIYQ